MDPNEKFNELKNDVLKKVYSAYEGHPDNTLAEYNSIFEENLENAIHSYIRINSDILELREISFMARIFEDFVSKYDFQQELSDLGLMPAQKKMLIPKYRDPIVGPLGEKLGIAFTVPEDCSEETSNPPEIYKILPIGIDPALEEQLNNWAPQGHSWQNAPSNPFESFIIEDDDDKFESSTPLAIHYPKSGPGFPPNTPPVRESSAEQNRVPKVVAPTTE